MKCRYCGAKDIELIIDLGFAPPSNAYLKLEDLDKPEITYPLRVRKCNSCHLIQAESFQEASSLFDSDYAYFSSASSSWVEHAKKFANNIIEELVLINTSFVVEVASNDGYLLQFFLDKQIPCLGVEPTESTASVCEKKGITVLKDFFGKKLAQKISKNKKADLIIGNNVYAHVPDIGDFTDGIKELLSDEGVVTLEFPHLLQLIKNNQFDTIYHEHYSYLSLHIVAKIFESKNLRLWRVVKLDTHGGSIRIYGCHKNSSRITEKSVELCLREEIEFGILNSKCYQDFASQIETTKLDLLNFLVTNRRQSLTTVGYGAAAKGNTLLNYAGVKPDLLPCIFDVSPSKQGKFMPGSHIKIMHPDEIRKIKPDIILILPWNISGELVDQLSYTKKWGCKLYTAIPYISQLK